MLKLLAFKPGRRYPYWRQYVQPNNIKNHEKNCSFFIICGRGAVRIRAKGNLLGRRGSGIFFFEK